jgi:hypothetical protein
MSSSNPNPPANGGYPPLTNNSGGYYPGSAPATIVNPSIYSYSSNFGTLSTGLSTSQVGATIPTGKFRSLDDGGIQLVFSEMEGNQMVSAELNPEHSITSLDTLRIQVLIAACNVAINTVKPLTYIRKHNLERHFKFST